MRAIGRRTVLGTAAAAALAAPLRAQTVLQLGSYPSNPPFEIKDERGQFDGLEIELVRLVAGKLGMTVQITDLGFQALFAATASRRIDLAVSSITVTPDRLRNQDFTQPYMDTDLALIAGPTSTLKGMDDLRGKVLGAIASSTGEIWIKANADRLGLATPKSYDTATAMFLDVSNGRVDGGVNDKAGSLYAFRTMRGMRVLATIPSGNQIAIMLPKGSPLTARINDAITELKRDGTVARLYEKWFGEPPAPGSSTVTPLPLPRAG
ncbi:ABC transporter substrate-binding protein [Roseomonas sp. BN140053]|uniref:ABC transporter substrate-binding protein n=1 Tax=Roseomonas sp. BN140053 TaxID=3391898 RepID=UPI0039E96DDE